MTVQTKAFQFDKDFPVDAVNRFYQAANLDTEQILNVSLIPRPTGAGGVYLITYDDVKAPYVIGTSPSDGSSSVPVSSDIVIQMSENIQQVQAADVEVLRNGTPVSLSGGDIVAGGGSWPDSSFKIQNAIDSTLNATYVVTLKTSIQDTSNNAMLVPYVFTFTTADQVSGLTFKSGVINPTPVEIAQNYADVAFGSGFASANYRLTDAIIGTGDPVPPGSGLCCIERISNKTVNGFRYNWNYTWPSGNAAEWIAVEGAPT
jgi:hypothetical protein